MGYNISIYKKIYEEYSQKYVMARERAQMREAELHYKIPQIAYIDRQLSRVGLEIFSAALSDKANYEERIAEIRKKNEELQLERARLLEECGYPVDYTDVKYECTKCCDTGFVDTKMCSCMREALVLAGIENSGFASLIREQNFDNFSLDYYGKNPQHRDRMSKNVDYLKAYAENFKDSGSASILMLGGTGLGKTHLSSALAKRVIERGNDVYYAGAIDLFSDFEFQRYKSNGREGTSHIDRYFDCDLLIIDDLGTEIINQFSVSTLYNLINDRLSRKKATVISTNLSKDEIQKKYTDRITSRLFGEYQVLFFLGTDVRAQKLLKK